MSGLFQAKRRRTVLRSAARENWVLM